MVTTLGGIGLFLLGMMLLTDGIKALAGTALREVLTRFVRGPVTATLSGAGLTALLQSSSATMLTTIGFVSAGLITFPQAVGVIFGANIGTTSTGWIVSMLGFKLSMGAIALPLVFLGALGHLLGRGRVASTALALAGFGLLFYGIGLMQEGMGGLADRIDLSTLPGDGLLGALVLVVVGVLMTVVMQSSSAAMAITLAALHTGGIDIEQGAAMVIGQNIGTTVTAALAAVGATTAAKRTAAAHIVFNLVTGVIAFFLLPAFDWTVDLWERHVAHEAGVGVLAGFHTAFNVIGVLLFLPVASRFARLIERLVPERGSAFARHLDPSVAKLGPVAIETARRILIDVQSEFTSRFRAVLDGRRLGRDQDERFSQARAVLPQVADFVAHIGAESANPVDVQRQTGLIHAMDHLEQLGEVIDRLDDRPAIIMRTEIAEIRAAIDDLLAGVGPAQSSAAFTERAARIADLRRSLRRDLLAKTARGAISATDAGDIIDTVRWLDAVGYHTSRAAFYLTPSTDQPPTLDSSSAHRE
jgi:phosphate:Na+ symporter